MTDRESKAAKSALKRLFSSHFAPFSTAIDGPDRPSPLPRGARRRHDLAMTPTPAKPPPTPKARPAPTPQPPRVPDGTRVYAIGDVHGRLDLLERLLKKITTDAAKKSTPKRRVLVMLGDLVDRGPHSNEVLDLLAGKPLKGFEAHFIKGNHEDMMLAFLAGREELYDWLANGGAETLESYGLEVTRDDPEALRDLLAKALPKRQQTLLDTMKLHHIEGDYLFVHAGVRPGITLKRQQPSDLMWIRESFLNSKRDFGHMVVHGHSIRRQPDEQANRIGIDTGAWMSERLTALVLEGETRRFLHT